MVGYSGDPDSGKQGASLCVVTEEEGTGTQAVQYKSPEFAARPYSWDSPGHPKNDSDPIPVDVYGDSHSSYVSTCSLAIPGTWKSWKPCTDHWTNQTCSHAASRGKCRRPTFQKMCRRTCRQCDDTNKN